VATLYKFIRAFSAAWRVFSFSNSWQAKWIDEDRTALVQFLNSRSGARLKILLLGYCALRDARACMAGGNPFEAGKSIGCREMVSYLDYLGASDLSKDSEPASEGDMADLGHLVP
jgi:hypothetical protein